MLSYESFITTISIWIKQSKWQQNSHSFGVFRPVFPVSILCPASEKKVLPRHELGLIKLHGIVEARVVFIVELRRPVFRVVLSGFLLERVIS